jgi:hypothetical protein
MLQEGSRPDGSLAYLYGAAARQLNVQEDAYYEFALRTGDDFWFWTRGTTLGQPQPCGSLE